MKRRYITVLFLFLYITVLSARPVSAASVQVNDEASLLAALALTGDVEIEVTADITLTSLLTASAGDNITISSTPGQHFTIRRGAGVSGNLLTASALGTLTLSDITLDGNRADNPSAGGALIRNTSRLILGSGAVITGNANANDGGGIYSTGTVTLDGGEISGNSSTGGFGGGIYSASPTSLVVINSGDISGNDATVGGGVHIEGGEIDIYGGTISNNTAPLAGGGITCDNGATIRMTGGEITGNAATNAYWQGGGGVACGTNSTFTMSGGRISGNSAGVEGGGVWVTDGADFTMSGGEISDNTATHGGGVGSDASFLLSGGTITGNTANWGGGVINYEGSFTQSGGDITGNSAIYEGGGVYNYDGTYAMQGGTVSGNTAKYGGGILHDAGTVLNITAGRIENNTASEDGGGICLDPANLPNLNVSAGVVFSGNRAKAAYDRKPADDTLYADHIFATEFSDPFTQGYNNWDISYDGSRAIYQITFDSDGGSAVPSETVYDGDAAPEPPEPTRPGYYFDGWYANPDGADPYNFNDPVHANQNLIARWSPVPVYLVRFVTGAGSEVEEEYITQGEEAQRPDDPVRSGYTFLGWYTDPECTVPYDFDAPVTGDLSLYARWEANPAPNPAPSPSDDVPPTGDNRQPQIWFALLCVSPLPLLCDKKTRKNRGTS